MYRETGLESPEMAQVRQALAFILRQQEPYPALVVDGRWNVLMSNDGMTRLLGLFLDPEALAAVGPPNAIRLTYHPRGLRPFIVNWEATAAALIQWLHRDMLRGIGGAATGRLLEELLSYPDVPRQWRTLDLDASTAPFLAVELAKGDVRVKFFSTLTSLGVPLRHHAGGAQDRVLLPRRCRERSADAPPRPRGRPRCERLTWRGFPGTLGPPWISPWFSYLCSGERFQARSPSLLRKLPSGGFLFSGSDGASRGATHATATRDAEEDGVRQVPPLRPARAP
jgi:hypothetical protein